MIMIYLLGNENRKSNDYKGTTNKIRLKYTEKREGSKEN